MTSARTRHALVHVHQGLQSLVEALGETRELRAEGARMRREGQEVRLRRTTAVAAEKGSAEARHKCYTDHSPFDYAAARDVRVPFQPTVSAQGLRREHAIATANLPCQETCQLGPCAVGKVPVLP
jgi:hypothetical protein